MINIYKSRITESISFKLKGEMTVKQLSASTSYQHATGSLRRYYSRSTSLGHLGNEASFAVQEVKGLCYQSPDTLQVTFTYQQENPSKY